MMNKNYYYLAIPVFNSLVLFINTYSYIFLGKGIIDSFERTTILIMVTVLSWVGVAMAIDFGFLKLK